MNEKIKKNSNILKDSTNPLNKESENDNKNLSNYNSQAGSIDSGKGFKEKSEIIEIPLKNNYFEDTKKTSLSDGNNNSDSSLKTKSFENLNFNSIFKNNNNIFITKKERYQLEQKMKKELKNNYKELEINKNSLKKNNLNKNKLNNINILNYNNSSKLINEINKNKKQIMKKLIKIEIPLLFLLSFNIILYNILYNKTNINNLDLYISSISLSSILCGFTLFLIILIFIGIFNHYYTANIFRFLCLINFGVSISLLIIQIILIFNFKRNINNNNEKKLFTYYLFISIIGITIIINYLIGKIAKDSLLIIGGCKNEDACPERKAKNNGKNKKEKYVYFEEEMDKGDININTLKKFHACIYSNTN